jgi:hypothetical protein
VLLTNGDTDDSFTFFPTDLGLKTLDILKANMQ